MKIYKRKRITSSRNMNRRSHNIFCSNSISDDANTQIIKYIKRNLDVDSIPYTNIKCIESTDMILQYEIQLDGRIDSTTGKQHAKNAYLSNNYMFDGYSVEINDKYYMLYCKSCDFDNSSISPCLILTFDVVPF